MPQYEKGRTVPTGEICLACKGTGITKVEINEVIVAFEIAQRRALERLTLQVKQEEQDETPPSKSPKSPQPGDRLTDRVTYLPGSQFSSLVELVVECVPNVNRQVRG